MVSIKRTKCTYLPILLHVTRLPSLLHPHPQVTCSLFLSLLWLSIPIPATPTLWTLSYPTLVCPPHPVRALTPWEAAAPFLPGVKRVFSSFLHLGTTTTLQDSSCGCHSRPIEVLLSPHSDTDLALLHQFRNKYSRKGSHRKGRERKEEKEEKWKKGRSMNMHLKLHKSHWWVYVWL